MYPLVRGIYITLIPLVKQAVDKATVDISGPRAATDGLDLLEGDLPATELTRVELSF